MNDIKADSIGDYVQLVAIKDGSYFYLLTVDNESDVEEIHFKVYEIMTWDENEKGEWVVPKDVELYLTGYMNKDGNSHIWFGQYDEDADKEGIQNGYVYLDGLHAFENHCKLMLEIWDYIDGQM